MNNRTKSRIQDSLHQWQYREDNKPETVYKVYKERYKESLNHFMESGQYREEYKLEIVYKANKEGDTTRKGKGINVNV